MKYELVGQPRGSAPTPAPAIRTLPPPPRPAPAITTRPVELFSPFAQDHGTGGSITTKLKADLEDLKSRGHPLDGTLVELATTVAAAADRLPPTDVRQIIAATKELRSLISQISGIGAPRAGTSQAGPGDDGGTGAHPFGDVRAEIADT